MDWLLFAAPQPVYAKAVKMHKIAAAHCLAVLLFPLLFTLSLLSLFIYPS